MTVRIGSLRSAFEVAEDFECLGDFGKLPLPKSLGFDDILTVEFMSWNGHESWAEEDVLAYGETWAGWWLIDASCDTSGWDCQAGGSIRLAPDKDTLVRFGMSKEMRISAGLALPEDT